MIVPSLSWRRRKKKKKTNADDGVDDDLNEGVCYPCWTLWSCLQQRSWLKTRQGGRGQWPQPECMVSQSSRAQHPHQMRSPEA